MDPQQELFSALLLELKKQYPDSVYDTDASADQADLQTSGAHRQLFLVREGLKSENIAGYNHQPATSSWNCRSDFFI